ncbi:MAG: 7-cyano-7-deazaguanine synthase QueC [Paludibacteraceae bacterium]|nr:7-cyano-7-deazaguanine synthase QueC [Paludibacteraceae bacterium]
MLKDEKALVIFSGGQDSTTCLFWAIRHFKEVVAVTFDYGQRHIAEIQCAKAIADELGVEHHVLDMALLNQLAPNSLTRTDIPVDESIPDGKTTPNSLVEGRNMLFLTFAAIMAKTKDIRHLVTGVCETDFSGYPDCRNVFIQSLNVTLNLSMDYQYVIHTPLMWLDKAQTWQLADEMERLDYIRTKTLTCYNGIIGDGCGHCPACTLRRNGLEKYVSQKLRVSENNDKLA